MISNDLMIQLNIQKPYILNKKLYIQNKKSVAIDGTFT